MEILVWMLVGGLLGWVSYVYLRMNEDRGPKVAVLIGAVGALVGVKAIAPLFVTAVTTADELSLPLLMFAAGAAAVCLVLSNVLNQRWGV